MMSPRLLFNNIYPLIDIFRGQRNGTPYQTFTYSKSTVETLEKGVKDVPS